MISIRFVVLTAIFAIAAPAAARAQCRQGDLRSSGFHLDLDWERATYSGGESESRRLFPANPGRFGRAPEPDCVFAAAADRPRLVLASDVAPAAATTQSGPDVDAGGPAWLRPFTFFVSLGGLYDSNINHDEEPIRTWAGFLGGGVRFETDDFYAQYDISSFSYTYTESGWSRISHRLETAYEHDLSKKWEAELVGEATLKGSSEDNDLGDEYVLKPRLNYDLSDSQRLRLYGAYRFRSYGDVDPLRDANNYYAGLQLRQRIGSGQLEAEYRWEVNESKGPRNQYNRQTYGLEYSTPLHGGRHQLQLEARYRPVQYWNRRIDNEDDEDLRRDVRWIGTATAGFGVSRHISIHPSYRYERRTSNDPEEEWDAHLGILAVRYTFSGARSVAPVVAARETPVEKEKDESDGPSGSDPRRGSDPSPKTEEASAAALQPSLPNEPSTAIAAAAPAPAVETVPPPDPIEPSTANAAAAPAPAVETAPPPDPMEPWVQRAEADRRRLSGEKGARYSVELAPACDAEALARIWKHDAGGALWLLPDPAAGASCFRVFWGRYPSQVTAERALSAIPPALLASGRPPKVIVAVGGLRDTR